MKTLIWLIPRTQLPVFIRTVAKYVSVHEDLVGSTLLRDTTRGVDIKEAVLSVLQSEMPNTVYCCRY